MKLTILQKEILFWILFCTLCAGVGIYYINHTPNANPGLIRLHIVANSDAPEDQMLKLAVRNAVLQAIEGQDDVESARAYIQDNLTEIQHLAEQVIQEKGFAYTAKAQLKVTYIPEKSYEDLTLPAGNYEALKITLGRGRGQNWWCVIFPQLCLVSKEKTGEKLVLKSKVKTMMKK